MKVLPGNHAPLSKLADASEFQDLKQWSTDPFEVKIKTLYNFAFELTIQDGASEYFYIPDKHNGEDFIKGPIKAENLQNIYIFWPAQHFIGHFNTTIHISIPFTQS